MEQNITRFPLERTRELRPGQERWEERGEFTDKWLLLPVEIVGGFIFVIFLACLFK